uniref:THAP-type domain-containing protein n=1 Tax=Sander lucioperca TaxID=283035 RepID=A0A8D0A0P6_SANLU
MFLCRLSQILFFSFLRFPKNKDVRKKWEVALRREGFTASCSSVLCSHHFNQGDFDRTGQIVRLRDGVIPSIFSFPTRLNEALARVESLEREKKNAMAREKRAKTTVKSLLGDLREKDLINEELKEKLEFYSEDARETTLNMDVFHSCWMPCPSENMCNIIHIPSQCLVL